ncbi:MAG TPA: cysteine--tRNA ligase [Caulobacteraceae bacterium]|jgi:cysteinyl-tRNA synthetase|nr:cysteine--tRNA ligase [Caulobacteraceae bacterium]
MVLSLHDTYARKKRPFEPRDPKRVTLYVCGPTVYNYAHIGNARPAVVFDVLFRVLRRAYGEKAVIYARNVTDVDDKINQAAIDQGVPISTITDKFAAIYNQDMASLGVVPPTLEPHATAYIAEMVDQIGRLVDAGAAYPAEGHVLFDTTAFADYGKLSGRSLDDMIAGARVEVAPYKKNAADFVLWKPSKPGEPVWDSPWGPGRPGWHIECSAMIEKTLGLPIDIHGGGHDLIFPHHENEIAQGVCANHGAEYARYWMHNGFLTIEAEKMSKSVGNVLLVHELVKQVPGEAIRWALLSAHYRAPLDWTGALIEQSRDNLNRLYRVLGDADRELAGYTDPSILADGLAGEPSKAFEQALNNDLNTPEAMAELFRLADELRQRLIAKDKAGASAARIALRASAAVLGFLESEPDAWFQGDDAPLKARIGALVAARGEARRAKDWAAADKARAELTELKVEVMDGPDGTATWRFKD